MKKLTATSFSLLLFLFCSCKSSEKMPILSELSKTSWSIASLMGQDASQTMFPQGLPSISFLDAGKLAGYTGCNNFSGNFSLEGESITLNPGAITRKACEGNGERDFITALESVNILKAGKNQLTLLDGTTQIMKLIPKVE
jgi:heat shock protein HslJ